MIPSIRVLVRFVDGEMLCAPYLVWFSWMWRVGREVRPGRGMADGTWLGAGVFHVPVHE